jgi:hypothetical protein
MNLRKSIFDSAHEKELFNHLESNWKNHFKIYPQLPFTKIFNVDQLNVSFKEKDFILKTNIDYTICDKLDKPLMCIEFDGWSHGYNRGGEYIQIVEDPLRKKKLELKLKIAIEKNFPFYIIAYDEKVYFSENIHLTVIDGIIGETIAKINFKEKINEYLEDSKGILDSMSEYERHEYIQDLVISTEFELELKWNPISRRASEIQSILHDRGIVLNFTYQYLSKPELPEIKDFFDIERLEARLDAMKNIEWQGCKASCETPKGKVIQQAWVRNFEGMHASPLIIVKNIAELLLFCKVAKINGIKLFK